MKIPTVPKFCCLNLKTFGIIYGYLVFMFCAAIFSILFRTKNFYGIAAVVSFGYIFSLWMDGINKVKPDLMLPALVINATISVLCFVFVSALHTITITVGISHAILFSQISSIDIQVFGAWILAYFVSIFLIYVTIAMYSLYKKIKDEAESSGIRMEERTAAFVA